MRTKQTNRIRRTTKYVYIAISIILIIVSFLHFVTVSNKGESIGKRTEQIYSYKNKFNYDYNVKLIDNDYTTGMNLSDKSLAYITSLIDNIEVDLKYSYEGDKKSELEYEYEVIGRMQAVYNKDGEEQKILEKEDILLEKQSKKETSNKLNISEKINLDLKKKNSLLNELKQKQGINFTAVYSVILKVNVKTDIEGKEVSASYSPVITVDLAEKTTKIKGENNKEDTQFIAKEISTLEGSSSKIIDIIGIIIALVLLRYATKAKVANIVRNEYKYELNRLLKLCQDKIVRVNTKPDTSAENTVIVKDFGEIVKLSEELFKPILCYIDEEQDEAWFSVMSNDVDYRYILKK